MRVLHINTEDGWRGGENQLRLLLNGMIGSPIESHLLLTEGSEATERLSTKATPCLWRRRRAASFRNLAEAYRYCVDNRIDLIHAHSSRAHTIAVALSKFLKRTPIVVHRRVHDRPANNFYHRWKYQSSAVRRFFAVSEAVSSVLVEYGVAEKKIDVIHSGISLSEFENFEPGAKRARLAAEYQFDVDLPIVGNAGALTSQKDHATLLRAIGRLQDRRVDTICLIAGHGILREKLTALSANLGISHCVRFLGELKDIRPLLAGCDIFAMPSANEGLGTALLEAAASDCSLIATNVGGIPEFVKAMHTGILVEPGDDAALANGIELAIRQPVEAAAMRRRARTLLEQHFTAEAMVAKTLKSYEAAAGC